MARDSPAGIIGPSMSPLIIALFIVLCVALVGAFAAFVRDRARYSGYRDIMREVIAFSKTIDGEIFRDAGDLVVSGEYLRKPLVVRFSHAENTPGLSMRLGAPATFSMAVFPRGQHAQEGGALVKTADDVFNTKFDVRTDQPTEARLYLGSPRVLTALSRLCRSGYDFLAIGSATIEFGQLGYPTEATVRALPGHIEGLGTLSRELGAMPGADQVKVEPRQRQRDYILRATIAAGVIAVAATLYVTAHERPKGEQSSPANQIPEGIAVKDADIIPGVRQWRVVAESDTDPVTLAWFRDHGAQFSPHRVLDMNGTGDANDSAYLLVNKRGERRVALIIDGSMAYEARFGQMAAIMRVPKDAMAQVPWTSAAPVEAQGDGLLLVRSGEDIASGIILFYSGGRVMSAVPKSWQQVSTY
jgi:hypothetical protein